MIAFRVAIVQISSMENADIWCGIIWALAMGLAVGNYACSLIHRLPRGRLLLDKPPYCGSCGALLQVRDLFPVVSALLLRHRCRYCRAPYPVTHTVTEILVALLFVLGFLVYGFSETYALIVALGTFLIVLAAIEANDKRILGNVMLCVLMCGMLLRTLLDGGLFNFVLGGLYGVIAGALVWRKGIVKDGHIYRLPKPAELAAIGGVCAGASGTPLFLALYLAGYTLLRGRAATAFGVAVLLPLLCV